MMQDRASATLIEQVRSVLKSEIKDRDVVELETTQLILSRVADWMKLFAYFVAIPLALLIGTLAIWGITKFADLDSKFASVDSKLAEVQTRATRLNASSTEMDKKYKALAGNYDRYVSLGRKMEALALQSKSYGQQIQSLKNDVSKIGERVGFEPSAQLTPQLQRSLEESLAAFENFLQPLGYKPSAATKIHVKIVERFDSAGVVAEYDSSTNTLQMTPAYASQSSSILSYYTEEVVFHSNDSEEWNFPAFGAVRAGLICYFISAFEDDDSGCVNRGLDKWDLQARGKSRGQSVEDSGRSLSRVLLSARQELPEGIVDKAAFQGWLKTQSRNRDKTFAQIYANAVVAELGRNAGHIRAHFVKIGILATK